MKPDITEAVDAIIGATTTLAKGNKMVMAGYVRQRLEEFYQAGLKDGKQVTVRGEVWGEGAR